MYPVPKGRCRSSILFSGPTPAVRDKYFMLPSIMNGTILKRWLRNKRGALLIFEIANDIINVPERSRAYEHREQHKAIKTTA